MITSLIILQSTIAQQQFDCDGLTIELQDSRFPALQLQDLAANQPATEQAILDKVRTDFATNKLQTVNISAFNVIYLNAVSESDMKKEK